MALREQSRDTSKNIFLLMVNHLSADEFYHILRFMATAMEIGPTVAGSIAPVCRKSWKSIRKSDDLWERIKKGYDKVWDADMHQPALRSYRPESKSHMDDVIRTHTLIQVSTQPALHELEGVIESRKRPLTLTRLKKIFLLHSSNGSFYINANQTAENGGTFLTYCCEAQFVSERVIKSCVKELIQARGARPNVRSRDGYTPLAIAAARGLPTVVKYLLEQGADVDQIISGQFSLESNPRKFVGGNYNPLGFARELRSAELANGAQTGDELIAKLDECMDLIQKKTKSTAEKRKPLRWTQNSNTSILEIDLSALKIE